MDETAKALIDRRLALMNMNEARLHKEALGEGYKDEVCRECHTVFLAFHHFTRCQVEDCPMKARDSEGKAKSSILEQLLTPPQ